MVQHAEIAGRRIAFRHRGGGGPAVVFLPGYRSDMGGSKAQALLAHCEATGRECLLFDYAGCGASEGRFEDETLGSWRDDLLALIGERLAGPAVLVGSSMGGWLMLLAGLALGGRLSALVGIAAAPDFTDWGFDEGQKERLRAGETLYAANPYGPEPTPTHPRFWADGQERLLLHAGIALDCPVHLLHGQDDAEVPPAISLRLAQALHSEAVAVTLVKGGDHRLSRDRDIALLLGVVDRIA